MKKILIFAAILCSLSLKSQTYDGVYIGGSLSSCVSKFQAKGYRLVKYISSGAMMKGTMDGTQVELYVIKTPKSGIVWKVAVFFPERTSWRSLLSDYEKYYNILRKKYGETRDVFSTFESPYEDGDGYEMSALKQEKVRYLAFWETQEYNIMVEISSAAQVAIHYENSKNTQIKRVEEEEIELRKF